MKNTRLQDRKSMSKGSNVYVRIPNMTQAQTDDIAGEYRFVILGGGIVGAMVAWHLYNKGVRDICLVEQGDIAGPGSTSHASNFIYLISHNLTTCYTTTYSMEFYKKMGLYTACGGLEIALKNDWERVQELKRKHGSGRAYIANNVSEILSANETVERFPFLDGKKLWGSLWQPEAGLVHGADAASRRVVDEAKDAGALTVMSHTRATGLDIRGGRVRGVFTNKGYLKSEITIAALGVWGPILEEWTQGSVRVPLVCAYHPLIYARDVPELKEKYAATGERISYPLLRHQSIACYMRAEFDEMEHGYYYDQYLPVKASRDIRAFNATDLSTPTMEPLRQEEIEGSMLNMAEVVPSMLDWQWYNTRNRGKYFNGLLSHTVDGGSLVGPALPGLWLAEGVWIKDGPGIANMLADWIIDGDTAVDRRSIDYSRIYQFQRSPWYVRGENTLW